MTRIWCKSDCEFSNNAERVCSLDLVELSQIDGDGTRVFHCQQYIKGNKTRFAGTDIERSKMAGMYAKPITEGGTM